MLFKEPLEFFVIARCGIRCEVKAPRPECPIQLQAHGASAPPRWAQRIRIDVRQEDRVLARSGPNLDVMVHHVDLSGSLPILAPLTRLAHGWTSAPYSCQTAHRGTTRADIS